MQVSLLLSFREHDKIVCWYQRELEREQQPKYSKVTGSHVLEVDLTIFKYLGQLTRAGLHSVPGQAAPLDAHVDTILKDPRIAFRLNPLRRPASSTGEARGDQQTSKRKNDELTTRKASA